MLAHSFITLVFGAIAVSATGLDAATVSKVRWKMLSIVAHRLGRSQIWARNGADYL